MITCVCIDKFIFVKFRSPLIFALSRVQISLINSYWSMFIRELNFLNLTNCYVISIETSSSTPIFNQNILFPSENVHLVQAINRLLRFGIIRTSNSQWSARVRIEEIDEQMQMVVDYSRLNAITETFTYNPQPIQTVIASIETSNLFSKIVVKDALHQIGLTEASKEKTAFATGITCGN